MACKAGITRGKESKEFGNDVNSMAGEWLVTREQQLGMAEGQSLGSLPGCGLGRRLSERVGIQGGLSWPPAMVPMTLVESACIRSKSQDAIPER